MKKFYILPLIAALAFFVSCQKQSTEEEKKAEAERQVQEAEAKRRSEIREKAAIAEKTALNPPAVSAVTPAASPAP
jgi:Flp pilus assembly protein TadB